MLRLLADENFDGAIVRGLRRRIPSLPLVRVQDVGLGGKDDPTILEWAAAEGRIVLTHDRATFPKYAIARVEAGLAMPGVFAITRSANIGRVIEDVRLLAECSLEGEWAGQIVFVPL